MITGAGKITVQVDRKAVVRRCETKRYRETAQSGRHEYAANAPEIHYIEDRLAEPDRDLKIILRGVDPMDNTLVTPDRKDRALCQNIVLKGRDNAKIVVVNDTRLLADLPFFVGLSDRQDR